MADDAAAVGLREPDVVRSSPWAVIWSIIAAAAIVLAFVLELLAEDATTGFLALAVAIVACVAAALYDCAFFRIPNAVTYPAIIVGLLLHSSSVLFEATSMDLVNRWSGAQGPVSSFAGFGIGAGIGLFLLVAADLGGGDIKLLAAVGALLGLDHWAPAFFNMLAAAVVIGLLNVILARRPVLLMQQLTATILTLGVLRRHVRLTPPARYEIPLALPVLIGVVTAPLGGGYEAFL